MVAYNLVLALFPFALLVLFIFGRILQSQDVETSVLTTFSASSRRWSSTRSTTS